MTAALAGTVESVNSEATFNEFDLQRLIDRWGYSDQTSRVILSEHLLPTRLLARLHTLYPEHSGFKESRPFLFDGPSHYQGLSGFRQIVEVLRCHGIELGHMDEREMFVEVYRFKASKHILNTINWDDYEHDPMYNLIIPQAGMIPSFALEEYVASSSSEQRTQIALDYVKHTNPHDGNQLLNKPLLENNDHSYQLVEGSQHKYSHTMLVFDKSTQTCFSFCTYCFRHAQIRGGEDMLIQEDIAQIHDYLRQHPEVTDVVITGGDAAYIPYDRLRSYITPLLEEPALWHVRTVRLGSRLLTFQPELILSPDYDPILKLFDRMHEEGLQLSWMAHLSTPRELMNPTTIAAIRRLQNHGVVIRSQSPIMNRISLFKKKDGSTDIERTAQNWIDLANVLATLKIHFHSMYCARDTGEHHYFAAPLAEIEQVTNLVFRSLAATNRPSRYTTMTCSAGKVSILGTVEVGGEKALALKFSQARNMEWTAPVFLAAFDEKETRIDRLQPFDANEFFFEGQLHEIEKKLSELQRQCANGAAPKADTDTSQINAGSAPS